ncbi:Nif3-like dinuclear metal center hexameric protein [Cesiribacter sp. SM1]|uniref:Nif3-like dinuclear metal center hexameric protein n=1 Tax=Cesiribacter sp. SM1 TaxID=2861196 RepID=UPI001CD403BB|nr:Nif3-like dinuclear metal center hexameric protein [Cesiribacter sp. SM1]
MITINDITQELEKWAHPSLQESYDNSGLLTGSGQTACSGVLITLDCTEAVIDEAIERGCNLVVAHHPIVFKGLKRLTGRNYVERTIIKAIRLGVAIYAIHTNLDNVITGVNKKIADRLGLQDLSILDPRREVLQSLTFFVPKENTQEVLNALYNAGAGQVGNYDHCSFRSEGTGTFRPNEEANPTIGKQGEDEEVGENRVEVIFPAYLAQKVLQAMRQAHPYEEVAYFMHRLENTHQEYGSGMLGHLPEPVPPMEFIKLVKEKMEAGCVRYTALPDKPVQRIALCGGAGSFLLHKAIAAGADVFVSADFKYHEFFDAEERIIIADIGHYESESFTKELILERLTQKFSNFALYQSAIRTNPISYL